MFVFLSYRKLTSLLCGQVSGIFDEVLPSTFEVKPQRSHHLHQLDTVGRPNSTPYTTAMIPPATTATRWNEDGGEVAFGKKFSCPHCSYVANQKTNLINHLRTHTGERPFACPYCSFRANVRSNLKRHVLNLHHKEQNTVACSNTDMEKD